MAPNGTVVRSADIRHPFESERLGTGSQSANGDHASTLDYRSQTVHSKDQNPSVVSSIITSISTQNSKLNFIRITGLDGEDS